MKLGFVNKHHERAIAQFSETRKEILDRIR
jgi:hypothetical protein